MKINIGAKPLLGPTPVLVVGSYDKDDKPNLATVAWGGLCSSAPPCVAISLRKATKSFKSILEREAFTVSMATMATMIHADYAGLMPGATVDKFKKLKLTHMKSEFVDAPYADEFPVVLECELVGHIEMGSHTQFIGQIMNVKAEESVTRSFMVEGEKHTILETMKIDPLVFDSAGYKYHRITPSVGQAFSVGKKAMFW